MVSGTGHEELTARRRGPRRRAALRRRSARSVAAGADRGRLSRQARAGHPRPQVFPSHADAAVRPPGHDLAHRLHRRARLRDLLPRPGCRHDLGHDPRRGQERSASSRAASPRSTCCASKATCCSTPTTSRRCIRSRTKAPATRCGNSASTSPSAPARPAFAAPRSTTGSRARSASRSSACCSTARSRPTRATPVYRDGKKVGVVTCAMYSPLVKKSMGIARLDVDCAVQGTQARDPQQERRDQGDGAAAALRRSEEDQAHARRAEAQSARIGTRRWQPRPSSAGRSTERCLRSPAGIIFSWPTPKARWRSSTWPTAAPAGFFDGAQIIFIPGPGRRAMSRPLEALKPAQFYQAPVLRQRLAATEADAGQRAYGPARSISPAPKG